MLHADKEAAATELRLQLVALRERELSFHVHHYNQLGVATSVLMGVTVAFVHGKQPCETLEREGMHVAFKLLSFAALGCFSAVNVASLLLSILAPRLALCGPQGSMHAAVEALGRHRGHTFRGFGLGLAAFFASAAVHPWAYYSSRVAIPASLAVVGSAAVALGSALAIQRAFALPERVPGYFAFDDTGSPARSRRRLCIRFCRRCRCCGDEAPEDEAADAAAARSRPPPSTPRRLIAHLQQPMIRRRVTFRAGAPAPATASSTAGGEGGQQSGVRPLPPPPVVRLQSSHETLLAVDSLEAEGRFLEAAELLAERLQQIKAAADQHAADVPELPAEEGAQPAHTGSGGRLRRAWSAMASAWSVLRGYEEPPML